MKKYTIDDQFIGIFDQFIPEELIQKYINYFEFYSGNVKTYIRNDGEETSEDGQVSDETLGTILSKFHSDTEELPLSYISGEFTNIFFNDIYKLYTKKYPVMQSLPVHILDIKIQKTTLGQGYHSWHCENDGEGAMRNRILTFVLYLNDVEEGGETEFLYQGIRIKPKRNRLVLTPAYFTHTHRGNPPLSGDKYIITGWVETSY